MRTSTGAGFGTRPGGNTGGTAGIKPGNDVTTPLGTRAPVLASGCSAVPD